MIYLVRHGQTEANLEGIYYGRSESELTPKGMQDTKRAIKELKDRHIDIVISSPRQRCRVLADELCSMFDIDNIVDERIEEINFGIFEGLKYTEAEERYPEIWDNWVNAGDKYQLEGGESVEMFEKRIDDFADYIIKASSQNDIAVVSHGGVISSLICSLLQLDKENKWRFKIKNGSVITIDSYEGYAYIVLE